MESFQLIRVNGGKAASDGSGFDIEIDVTSSEGARPVSISIPLTQYEDLSSHMSAPAGHAARKSAEIDPDYARIGAIEVARLEETEKTHIGITQDGQFVIEAHLSDGTTRRVLLNKSQFEYLGTKISEVLKISEGFDLSKIKPTKN